MKANIPQILLIYTGGTIGMWKDFDTGALRSFDFNDLLNKIPEIKLLDCDIHTTAFETPIDSSNMTPKYWRELTSIISESYNQYDGFVVLHGSDTMSYTASACSFMLQNLTKPIIFTGSQLPIGDLRTDAKENLITSLQLASMQREGMPLFQEVCLYFEYKLYRANRTTKLNAAHFEAFASLNFPPLAESGVEIKVKSHLLLRGNPQKPLAVFNALETQVLLLKIHPSLDQAVVDTLFKNPSIKAVVLETYGSGNIPTLPWFIASLQQLAQKQIPIINVTQCLGGSVTMGLYETSVALQKMGVISASDMTTEATLAKLMHLLPQVNTIEALQARFEEPLAGECS